MRFSGALLSLKNISALITGGASGLGLATAKKLLQEGCKVLVCDINRTSEIDTLGGDVVFSGTDLPKITSEESVKAAIDLAKAKFSYINCVVNCAGVGISRKTISNSSSRLHDLKEFERVLKVNTVGTFNVIRLTALSMAQNEPDEDGERGVIINTASVSAFEGQVGQVAYAASKAAIVGMTLPVARDLSRHGIRCVTIAPGLIESKLLFGDRQVQPEVLNYINDVQLAIGRQGHPCEFADAVIACLREKMLNGATLRLDAGGIFDTGTAIAKTPKAALHHLVKIVPFPNRPGRPEEFAHLVRCIIENSMLNGTTIRLDGALRLPP
ncbi:3-hydroxyacyl-CoA dehydrogenase type-2 [Echinococcus granulosus]|uniref:3-hydroxyacyl-CoA dehydrogenase type-2 n=1 Tax=Echinococcus granulosus TaxID=6210 RepID=W6VDW4_ECHGR|nr:3-hydroxyacyl-CoA dehydrogenase type-2 [Echinococcus granulosus]EUB64949.1 3-hydroxyacyl-CoA dehydrogenase type-2 [Echinococcus granulosus]